MLAVLGVFAFVWACLLIAICAICAVAGAADEQSEQWYRDHKRTADDADQPPRRAACARTVLPRARVRPHDMPGRSAPPPPRSGAREPSKVEQRRHLDAEGRSPFLAFT